MAKIRYCDDSKPGITRRKMGRGWGYFRADGTRITDRDEIDRLNRIGLPPAYTDAWFCPKPNGHIQAVGWDDKGRKQYRYHADFRDARAAKKYDRCAEFGLALPALRKRVAADLQTRGINKARAVAAVVRLLDEGRIRVGNEAYAKTNKSFGATTLRKRHAVVKGRTLRLRFRAKSGKDCDLKVVDAPLVRFIKKSAGLRAGHLFAWRDEAGVVHPVTSADVNAYIRAATGSDFTAKHFRTWAASVTAFETLASAERDLSLKAMLEPVTEQLGNTAAIARKSYVHPRLIGLIKKGQTRFRAALKLPRKLDHLSRVERGLIAFLDGAPQAKAA
ncbi:MAG: DNA topoisomerase IB [Sphingomonas sp.]